MKRPLLWGFLSLSLGLILAFEQIPVWIAIGCTGLFLAMPFFIRRLKKAQLLFVITLYYVGIALGIMTFWTPDPLANFYEQDVNVKGIVMDYPIDQGNRYTIKLQAAEINAKDKGLTVREPIGLKVTAYDEKNKTDDYISEEPKAFSPGDVVVMTGKLTEPPGKRNPGGFDYALYLKSQSIEGLLTINPESIEIIDRKPTIFDEVLHFKRQLENTCDVAFSETVSDLLKGVIFGEKDISAELTRDFQEAGVTHVLSVSGLHVGYVFLVLAFLLTFFKINKRYWLIFLGPALFFYVALTGFVPPVIRAAIMLLCLSLGQGLHRETDSLNHLCLAGIVILLIWPAQLFQAGFQLTMGAMLGIILFYKPIIYLYEKRRNQNRTHDIIQSGPILQGLVLTFCATVGTLPILLYHFKAFTLISFFSNLLIVPLIGVFLLAGLLFLLIATIFPVLIPVLSPPISFLGETIVVVLQGINDIGNAMNIFWIHRGGLSIAEAGLFILATLLISGYFYLKSALVRNSVIAAGISLSMIIFITPFFPKALVVTILDVGQGDSILIETPAGMNYLVDGGGYLFETSDPISERVLYPALYAKNITSLDGVFLTHNHVDHAQGIEELMDSDYTIANLFMSIQTNNEKLSKQQDVPVTLLKKGSRVESKDGVSFEVYSPDGPIVEKPDDEQNNASLVMSLNYRNTRILLCGDAETQVEQQLIEDLQVTGAEKDFQIIKIGHHGSKTSSTEAFLETVDPEMAVISVGARNFYGHPDDEVIIRLETKDILTMRTDKKGAVEITTNGDWIHYKNYVN